MATDQPQSLIPPPATDLDIGGPAGDPHVVLLERIARSLDDVARRLAEPAVPRMLLRLEDLVDAIGLDRRSIQRERAAGRFPPPDVQPGRRPLWRPETVRAWIEAGGRVLPRTAEPTTPRAARRA